MSELRKMARDAGFNIKFDDYVLDHWQRFEKFAQLINAAALAQSEPEPLTEEEIVSVLIESAGMTVKANDVDLRFARAIERAHGIGGQP